MNDDSTHGEDARTDNPVFDAVVAAYYPRAVAAGEAARVSAQRAQSITTVVATALVAWSGLAMERLSWITAPLLWGAVAAWAISSIFYLWAVGSPFQHAARDRTAVGRSELVSRVIDMAIAERTEVAGRQRWGNRSAAAALVLTTIFFIASSWPLGADMASSRHVTLTSPSAAALSAACGTMVQEVEARADFAALEVADPPEFLEIELVPSSACGDRPLIATVRTSDIEMVVE